MLAAKAFFDTPVAQVTPSMEREFFSSLMTRNKTYKTTFEHRFADINPELVRQLRDHVRHPARILDLGVSSGVSTVELHDDLQAAGLDGRIVATDILVDACLVEVGPGCVALVDEEGFPLRLDLPFGSIKPWVTPQDYRTGFFVVRKGINLAMARRAQAILRTPDDSRITRVKLVTPRLLAKENIAVLTDDIRRYNEAFAGSFEFVRAANVLNLGYFPRPVLSSIIGNIRRYLSGPSSMLLVLRTHDNGDNHGTLFRLREDSCFEVVSRFGAGSEVESIVLQAPG